MLKRFYYNTKKYNFKQLFVNCLGKLEDIHKNHELMQVIELTSGGVANPKHNTHLGLIEKLFREVVHTKQFLDMWNDFCDSIVKPCITTDQMVIQKLPSIKIFVSKHEWRFVKNTTMLNGKEVNLHYENEYPFHHPEFEKNLIIPLIDMDQFNGLFIDGEYCDSNYGELLIFDGVKHGGYVKNESENTRVSIDFKACCFSNYNTNALSNDIKVKKRGKWIPQKELFSIGNYYRLM